MGCAFSKADAGDPSTVSYKSEDRPVVSVKTLSMEVAQPAAVEVHVEEIQIPSLQALNIMDGNASQPHPQAQAQSRPRSQARFCAQSQLEQQDETHSKFKSSSPQPLKLPKQPRSQVHHRQASFVLLQESLVSQAPATAPAVCKAAGLKHIGFGPMKKENQDEYFIQSGGFGGEECASLFCVFDGHGVNGRASAAFCCQALPDLLATHLRAMFASAPTVPYPKDWLAVTVEHVICEVFQETEQRLQESGVNLSSSGTTASIVYMHGAHVWVAAVGDSRVVLCQKDEEGWSVQPLTLDHRPSRAGEKARVEAAGGRVEPKRLASGRLVGEPRLWLANLPSPGLLLSRSLGDLVASSVGCTCTPEVTYLTLQHPQDRFLVLGSDGVWDVLTNEQVCEVVKGCSTPEDGAQAVLEAALYEWEERMSADNISIVVVQAVWPDPMPADGMGPSEPEDVQA